MTQASNRYSLRIEKLVAGGEGLGRVSAGEDEAAASKVVFVPFVVPGECVSVRVTDRKSGYERAELVELLEPSQNRVKPFCPLFGICGGCTLQHMSYEEQLRQKLSIVSETFLRTGGFRLSSLSMVPCQPLHYRNRVQLHRDSDGSIGFRMRGTDRIVVVQSCPIAHRAINDYLSDVHSATRPVPPVDRFTVVGTDRGAFIEGQDESASITILSRKVLFAPGVFFQSNVRMLELMVPWVVDGLRGNTAADLYAGVGLFSIFLSDRFDTVHAVEENRKASSYAKKNLAATTLADSGRANFHVHPQRVEHWLSHDFQGKKLDAVVVDPPRTGLSKSVRRELIERRVPEIRYVSCNPVTLARDASHFLSAGYEAGSCTLFDFYPHTAHIEAVLSFTYRSTGQ